MFERHGPSDRDDERRARPAPGSGHREHGGLRASSILALQRTAGNQAVVARLKLSHNAGVYARDDVNGTIETRELDKQQRTQLVNALQTAGDAALLAQVQADWRAARGVPRTQAPDISQLGALLAFGDRLTAVEQEAAKRGSYKQVPGKDKEDVDRGLGNIKVFIHDLDEGTVSDPGDVLRDTVHALLARLSKLTGAKDLITFGIPPECAGPVTAQDIADYRADTLEIGVFAGPAEAEAVAQALHVQFDIFVVAGGLYRRAYPNIGANQVRTGRSLLFLGNHYLVLRQADLVDGQPAPPQFPVVAATETRGDCLYEGISIVASGHKPANYAQKIQHLRSLASQGMSDVAVETAITLIRSGSRQGVGTRMSRTLRDTGLRHLAATLKERDKAAYAKHEEEISRMFKDYDAAAKRTGPEDEPPWELSALEEKLAAVAEELMPEEEDANPLSRPKTLFRYVSTEGGKNALKDGIKFDPEGGGIPTSTKGDKGVAITSGAVALSVLLRIDTSKISDVKFEYVPTRSKLKEVKIKCDVPADAIS
jgi:hypothetical protein